MNTTWMSMPFQKKGNHKEQDKDKGGQAKVLRTHSTSSRASVAIAGQWGRRLSAC